MEQVVGAQRGDIQVGMAVVVVVAHRAADAVERHGQPGGAGNVGEMAPAIAAVERLGKRALAVEAGQRAAVDQEQVEVPVAVIVKEGTAGAKRLGEVETPAGAIGMPETDPRRRRHIIEPQRPLRTPQPRPTARRQADKNTEENTIS